VRRLLPILLVLPALSACGGSKHALAAGLSGASGRTVAAKTASFTLVISAKIGSLSLQSSETGSFSFSERRAHFYKLVPGGGTPQEVVLDGPYAYTNANVAAALMSEPPPYADPVRSRRCSARHCEPRPDLARHR